MTFPEQQVNIGKDKYKSGKIGSKWNRPEDGSMVFSDQQENIGKEQQQIGIDGNKWTNI